MTTQEIIDIATKHSNTGWASSAKLALSDAVKAANNGQEERARRRALKSLQFSVGIFHVDFLKVAERVKETQ
jgi:hypothetical protein